MITSHQIFKICQEQVDLTKLIAKNQTLCLDGTSCTGKTTILNNLRQQGNLVYKINKDFGSFKNIDTYFPQMIGYVSSGIMSLLRGGPHFNDRSPLNCIEWHYLWCFMNKYFEQFGNTHPEFYGNGADDDDDGDINENKDKVDFINNTRIFFRHLHQTPFYKSLRQYVNCIALIDSNTTRCDFLHYIRNEDSDVERAKWKCYTYFQNLMYQELYPKLYIDLVWFPTDDFSVLVEGIQQFLSSAMAHMQRNNLPCMHAPQLFFQLPSAKNIDYTLKNMETHAYRSIGRWSCKNILNKSINKHDTPNVSLKQYIPDFLCVSNIKDYNNKFVDPIQCKSIKYLLNNDDDDDTFEELEESHEGSVDDKILAKRIKLDH